MKQLIKELIKEKKHLEKIISMSEEKIKLLPDVVNNMCIRAMIKGGTVQLYVRDNTDIDRYKYVDASNKKGIIDYLNIDYHKKVITNAKNEIKSIDKLLKCLKDKNIDSVYSNMGKAKQLLIKPVYLSDKLYKEQWIKEEYVGKGFEEGSIEIYTEKGERVRSKSEKIIADKLYKENIDYKYEYPINIHGWGEIYPDFTILDKENRRNIILEHFGMMDDENYANNAIAKIQQYANIGYHLGDNLYITMETFGRPFDSRILDGIIKQLK